jgi:dTDP-4-dehydrorhamnose reductase
MNKKILITGGTGRLGEELKKIMPNALFPLRKEFDVTSYETMVDYLKDKRMDLIIHAAAETNLEKIKKDSLNALNTNILGTANLVKLCLNLGLKLVYISTDYVFKGDKGDYSEEDPVFPVNKYGWSKLGGECAVQMMDNFLIIRTSFGKAPFPYEGAFIDQYTIRENVKYTAEKIKKIVEKDISGIIHIGGNKKTVYEYAKEISPEKEIKKISIKNLSLKLPKDTSLNLSRYNQLFKKINDSSEHNT